MRPHDLLLLREIREMCLDGRARAARLDAGLKLWEIAEACDVSDVTVQRWETGQRVPRGPGGLRYARVLRKLGALTIPLERGATT